MGGVIKDSDQKSVSVNNAPVKAVAHRLNQCFDDFSYRCTFMLTALEKIAFDEEFPNVEPSSLGASLYVGELIEELTRIQQMVDELQMEALQLE